MTARGETRIVFNSDNSLVSLVPHKPETKEDLCPLVDDLAANGVDMYVQDVFSSCLTRYDSKFCERWDRAFMSWLKMMRTSPRGLPKRSKYMDSPLFASTEKPGLDRPNL